MKEKKIKVSQNGFYRPLLFNDEFHHEHYYLECQYYLVIDHFLKNFDIIFGLYDCGFTCHVLEILSKKFECLWHKITCNMVHLHSLL